MTARMPSPQCRTVLRHLYQFLAPLISHPWGCCFHITTLLPATGPATACVCVCALGLGAEGDGRNHRPSPRFHRRTIPRSRHIDTSTHRQRFMPKKTAAPGLPVGGGARSARGSAPKSRSTAGQDTDAAAGRSSDERPAPAATSARARSRKKVDSSAAGSSSSEEVAPTASGADAQIVEDPASSNTVDEKLKFALKVRDSMLRDAVDAASRFTVS